MNLFFYFQTKMGVKKRPRCFFDVTISGTRVGRVIFELFSDITPITCENFRGLCTGEKGLGKKTGDYPRYSQTTVKWVSSLFSWKKTTIIPLFSEYRFLINLVVFINVHVYLDPNTTLNFFRAINIIYYKISIIPCSIDKNLSGIFLPIWRKLSNFWLWND